MLVSSLGGSAIESWISQEHLKTFPELLFDKAALDSMKLAQQDKGTGCWQQKNFDDTDWATMDVPGYWQENGIRTKVVYGIEKSFVFPIRWWEDMRAFIWEGWLTVILSL